MIDGFLFNAILAGLGIAAIACPLGCFIVWRRMSYFGATLTHSSLLGVAVAVLVQIAPFYGVVLVGAVLAPTLLWLKQTHNLPTDALLGILAHTTLAIGLVTISLLGTRIDLMAFLFGSILTIEQQDLLLIAIVAPLILIVLAAIWKPLLAQTVSADIAAAETPSPQWVELTFVLLVVAVIALSMKLVGALLILSLLIIPSATARSMANSPEAMAIIATLIGMVCVIVGIHQSATWDTPAGPSIVVVAATLFAITTLWRYARQRATPAPPIPHHHHDYDHGAGHSRSNHVQREDGHAET